MQKLPHSYLFRTHTSVTLINWAQQLRYFYFLRAWGGHANDDDTFQAGILYYDRSDLEAKLNKLGIVPEIIRTEDPKPVPGQSYRGDEFAKLKIPVHQYPDMAQPGLSTIAGSNVYLRIERTMISLSVSGSEDGNRYEVSQADFKACLRIEAVFDSLNWSNVKYAGFEERGSCLSPNIYPELF